MHIGHASPYLALPLSLVPGLLWDIARESTQYEYQYIQMHGGLRANMPALEGLKFWRWTRHSILETIYAFGASVTVALAALLLI